MGKSTKDWKAGMPARPLRNFEVDRYWLKVGALAVRHSWTAVFEEFSWWRIGLPMLVACVASAMQFYVTGWASTEENLKIVGTSVAAGLCVFLVLIIIHLVRKPCELDIKAEEKLYELLAENARLKQPKVGLAIAEEDPKVYLEPLNNEFATTGTIPFELANLGQRINVAHNIVIDPLSITPAVSFDYLHHLDMAERKRITPAIPYDGNPMRAPNILTELAKAWEKTDQAPPYELPFDVRITYQDVTEIRKFEHIVKMVYHPIAEMLARKQGSSNVVPRVEHKIITVVQGGGIRRLA